MDPMGGEAPSAFYEECAAIGPVPRKFSPRLTVVTYDEQSLLLQGTNYAHQTFNLTVQCRNPAAFPLGGDLYAARLADDECSIRELLQKLSEFLGRTEAPSKTVIPIPDQKTHVIGVFGPRDLDTEANEWIGHTFGGISISEKWISAVDLHRHAAKRGDLLHGQSTQPRRVVINEDTPKFYNVVPDAFTSFDSHLKEIVTKAKPDERIFIIICAHGIPSNGAVVLGTKLFTRHKIQGILCQAQAPTTIFMTSYSGLWAFPYQNHITETSTVEDLAEPVDPTAGQTRSLPLACAPGMAAKILDLRTVGTTTAIHAITEKFQPFPESVSAKLGQRKHSTPSLCLAPQDSESSVATIMGFRNEVALLFRLAALKELPTRANYATVPLGVQEARVLTGSFKDAVLGRADLYWEEYPARREVGTV
ncbi:hypothetical protein B0H19DRAFT_1267186 [Mycena capillaripes]|nr:hypothetical protein B0H19DRAFT_1267186 [Mycena capillaripes]